MRVAILSAPFFFVFFHCNCGQLNESLFLPLISCRKANESCKDIMQNLLSFSYIFFLIFFNFHIDLIQCYPGYLVPELINNYLSTFQPALFFCCRTRDRVDQSSFEFSIANGMFFFLKRRKEDTSQIHVLQKEKSNLS